jgi:RNA polymerase sigma factor (sigma-70 family)
MTLRTMTDPELWNAVVDGDSAAWKELIQRYESLVYSVITRVGLSYHEAADCFQNTWVMLHSHRGKIKDSSRLPGWLATTARREAIKVLRRGRKHTDIEEATDFEASDPLPDQVLEQLQLQSTLQSALGQIDDRCAKLLQAMFLSDEDASYDDIAAQFGISSNALGPARRRCLDRLKKVLEESGFTSDARNGADEPLEGSKGLKRKIRTR